MVKNLIKVKDHNHELSIAIKKNYEAGMRPKEIAKLFKISKQRINYWIHNPIIYKRKRRTKLTRNERNLIIKWAKDKPINFAKKFKFLTKEKNEKEDFFIHC